MGNHICRIIRAGQRTHQPVCRRTVEQVSELASTATVITHQLIPFWARKKSMGSTAVVQVAPYITAWSAEQDLPCTLVERPGCGVAYADELLVDRDSCGVLWRRSSVRRQVGRPDFGRVHPLRQRRAMLRVLCQVCSVLPIRRTKASFGCCGTTGTTGVAGPKAWHRSNHRSAFRVSRSP
jgi:hypothetical protein